MSKYLQTLALVGQWLVIVPLAIIPLFFLPVTADFYDINKWFLLIFAGLALAVTWVLRAAATKTFVFEVTPGVLGFAGLALAAAVSLVLASPNKVEALLSTYGAGTFTTLAVFTLIGSTFLDKDGRRFLLWFTLGVSALAALIAIYQFFHLGKLVLPAVSFLSDPLWTPVGSTTALSVFLLLTLPLAAGSVLDGFRRKKDIEVAVGTICFLIILAGLCLTLVNLVPKLPTTLFPLPAGWAVVLEAYKSLRQALFGIGSENYLGAFTAGRPAWLNSGQFWNIRASQAPSLALELATTLGFLGVIGLTMLMRGLLLAVKDIKADTLGWGLRLSLLLALTALLFAPPSLTLLIVTAIFLIISGTSAKRWSWQISERASLFGGSLVVLVLLVLAAVAVLSVRAYAAEATYFRSLLARQKGNGAETYNRLVEAVNLNPSVSRFHTSLSQTSLELTNALISSATAASPSGRMSGQDQKMVTQLVQQSISEAKLATNLAPSSILVWENLASIYESIMKVAQGADQWAIAAYQKSIQLDPTNPVLRLRLGGVYVSLGRLDEAATQFQMATLLKPDYANAHYNLAFVFRQQKKFLGAALELAATKRLVLPGSDDEKKVTGDLEDVKRELSPAEKNTFDQQSVGGNVAPGTAPGIVSPVSTATQSPATINLSPEASPAAR